MSRRPKTICELTKPNFETLKRAFDSNDVALMECRRKRDGAIVALLCAKQNEEDGSVTFVPFAEMLRDNPYEQYDPPNPEGGF